LFFSLVQKTASGTLPFPINSIYANSNRQRFQRKFNDSLNIKFRGNYFRNYLFWRPTLLQSLSMPCGMPENGKEIVSYTTRVLQIRSRYAKCLRNGKTKSGAETHYSVVRYNIDKSQQRQSSVISAQCKK